jgi:hypothetical protein
MSDSFAPIQGATVSRAASSSSSNVAMPKCPAGAVQVRVYNSGTDLAFVAFGTDSTAAAATTDYPVPGGAIEVITLTNPASARITYAAAITASGTPTLYFTPGYGI